MVSHRLGALPTLNHFLDRIGLDAALQRWLPEPDRRFKLLPATAIRLLVVNQLVGAAPLYGLGEWVGLCTAPAGTAASQGLHLSAGCCYLLCSKALARDGGSGTVAYAPF